MRCVRAKLTSCFYPLVRDQYNVFQPERSSRAAAYTKMYVPRDSKLKEGFHTNRYSFDDSLIMRLTLFGVVSGTPAHTTPRARVLLMLTVPEDLREIGTLPEGTSVSPTSIRH